MILDALLSEQHVTRAAERLHLSQPAVSHALGRLRDLLGDPLLVRVGGSLAPTARALELVEPLRDALTRVQALLAPGELLLNGEIDLAAGVFPDIPNELRCLPLFEERYVCLVDRQSLPSTDVLDLPTYLSRPHVLLEMRGSGTAEIERALTAINKRRHVAISLPHWGVAPQLIKGTDLILTVASRNVRAVSDPDLGVLPVPFKLPSFSFVLACHKRREGDQALAWLMAQIQTLDIV